MLPVEIAEFFHLAFLQSLSTRVAPALWVLKGGGNLRFFYPSERFSEDIDLDTFDVDPWLFQDRTDQTLGSSLLVRTLGVLGVQIDYVNPKERSGTKSKWVVGLREGAQGMLVYTQVEVSHREYPYRPFAAVEPVSEAAAAPYAAALRRPVFGHYQPHAATRQKITALWDRDVRQARDVFDLDLLFRVAPGAVSRGDVPAEELEAAIVRAFEIGYDEYRSKVLSFIAPDALPIYEPESVWEDMQLTVTERLRELRP